MEKQVTGEKKWYAIHTYSGYEKAVCRNLKQRVGSLGLEESIFEVLVPTEKKIRIKGGKKVEVEEYIYPGYVLVNMVVNDESWYAVRNTERVTGFVGVGVRPVPLADEEVERIFKRMNSEEKSHEIDFSIGEAVKIVDGPFSELEGKIGEVDREKGKVKVYVSMFGKETPVELDFIQIRQI